MVVVFFCVQFAQFPTNRDLAQKNNNNNIVIYLCVWEGKIGEGEPTTCTWAEMSFKTSSSLHFMCLNEVMKIVVQPYFPWEGQGTKCV